MTIPSRAPSSGTAPSSGAAGSALAFDFGKNWAHYSRDVLDEGRVQAAVDSLTSLIGVERLAGARVCDVGSGSGLFTIAASRLGIARGLGFDINPTSVAVAEQNLARFGGADAAQRVSFAQGSALDAGFVGTLGRFDVVYAWGSLHHTGAMDDAIANTARLVDEDGVFVLAIYNRHWSSPAWTWIKRVYNLWPERARKPLDLLFGGVIYAATRLVTGTSPLTKERGMDFRYDVIDWLGGYPYEYASVAEITERLAALGFALEKVVPPRAPTGCNEFVFRRVAAR